MPELPEVETLVRRLREPVIGRTIEDVTIYWKRTVARPAPKEFARLLRGYTVQAIDRRAKYLVFDPSQGRSCACDARMLRLHYVPRTS